MCNNDILAPMTEKEIALAITDCSVSLRDTDIIKSFSWKLYKHEKCLLLGPSDGGKDIFVQALGNRDSSSSKYLFTPKMPSGQYYNTLQRDTVVVSLETAAALIQEERVNDQSEFTEGGIDSGRTARKFILEAVPLDSALHKPELLNTCREVELCGVQSVLNRGLKYLSTGEIRRVLLCRALLSGCKLLILSEPFAGLDVQSRNILRNFFSALATEKNDITLIISMERYDEIPEGITSVLEFTHKTLSFIGNIEDYEALLETRKSQENTRNHQEALETFEELHTQQTLLTENHKDTSFQEEILALEHQDKQELVSMKNVHVEWGGNVVLDKLTWTLYAGEHWLIRGPNGSGKTTFLELITGDNMQVFANDVRIFGHRRGTGETIWELKEKMGIVSYRLHLEYRMVGSTDIEAVLLSGFHDSIGLYQQRSQVEQMTVAKWLKLGGFQGREHTAFNSLSYGEQRAILILRAVVKCPLLLILDEPCHGLDEEQRSLILQLLEKIASTGTTTLLHVTHDPTEVLSCEKHILELSLEKNPGYRILCE